MLMVYVAWAMKNFRTLMYFELCPIYVSYYKSCIKEMFDIFSFSFFVSVLKFYFLKHCIFETKIEGTSVFFLKKEVS